MSRVPAGNIATIDSSVQRRDLELLVVDRQVHQREVGPVLEDVVDAGRCRRIGDDEVDAGMIEPHAAQDRRQPVDHGRQRGADMHLADPALAKAPHGGVDLIALVENALRGLHQRAARRGGMRLLAETFDQLQAEAPLEFADLQTDRRLCQVRDGVPRRRNSRARRLRSGLATGRG